ncbi:hypothetical protein JW911_03420 [Candidatus Peregrinibacteria bacterium]|nr:hypothetical protein [Candidatus Peregrinibacteria bacterium]
MTNKKEEVLQKIQILKHYKKLEDELAKQTERMEEIEAGFDDENQAILIKQNLLNK